MLSPISLHRYLPVRVCGTIIRLFRSEGASWPGTASTRIMLSVITLSLTMPADSDDGFSTGIIMSPFAVSVTVARAYDALKSDRTTMNVFRIFISFSVYAALLICIMPLLVYGSFMALLNEVCTLAFVCIR